MYTDKELARMDKTELSGAIHQQGLFTEFHKEQQKRASNDSRERGYHMDMEGYHNELYKKLVRVYSDRFRAVCCTPSHRSFLWRVLAHTEMNDVPDVYYLPLTAKQADKLESLINGLPLDEFWHLVNDSYSGGMMMLHSRLPLLSLDDKHFIMGCFNMIVEGLCCDHEIKTDDEIIQFGLTYLK